MDIKEMNRQIIDEFRANAGKVGGMFAGAPVLLLTTKGAKSGETRVNPLVYFDDAGRTVIIASYAGAAKNPPWYHNLVANPTVSIEVGAQTLEGARRGRAGARPYAAVQEDGIDDAGVHRIPAEDETHDSGDRVAARLTPPVSAVTSAPVARSIPSM